MPAPAPASKARKPTYFDRGRSDLRRTLLFGMAILSGRAARFMRAWLRAPGDVSEEEVELDRGGVVVPATVVRPSHQAGPLPGWVVLHGMTRPGRAHKQLVRFTRALVSSQAVAIVPEVPEWRSLRLAPHLANPTVQAGIEGLRASRWVADGPVGVIGFSFGAPHAITSAAAPELATEIGGVVGFGGYCDIESTFHFFMTGKHEHGPVAPKIDPYGRWIVAANYLAEVPAHSDAEDVADALRELAQYAGDLQTPSWLPVYDPVIEKLRARVSPPRRELFDLFAPGSGVLPDPRAAIEIADGLAEAARRTDPLLDPRDALGRVSRPAHVIHGRNDLMIPASETIKIGEALSDSIPRFVTVTRLFGHSSQDPFPALRMLQEVPRFTRALSGMLSVA